MKSQNKIVSFFRALFVDSRRFKPIDKLEAVVHKMGPAEKGLFYFFCIVVIISGLLLLYKAQEKFLVEVPAFGGSFVEGVVGSPRFINPVLAISDTDKDLVSLIYAGLLRPSENGGFKGDLASTFSIEEEGLAYRVILRDNAVFHDGTPVTADDVIFTIGKARDPVIKSPRAANWEGVLIEKISEQEIIFRLGKPYAPFIEALTLGILPKHIWENVSSEEFPFSQFNIDPIGAGPYKVEKIIRNSGGIPTNILLSSWKHYAPERPKIKSITFKFFPNEDELYGSFEEGEVDSLGSLSPTIAKRLQENNQYLLYQASLPRVFGVFFNQNTAPVFLNNEVRGALSLAVPKQRIVSEILKGYGRILNGPTPDNVEINGSKASGDLEAAKALLSKAGWEATEEGVLQKKTKSNTEQLVFSITTSDAPELKQTAMILKEVWEALGAKVDIKVFEAADLSQNIIKGRKYEALLFGEVVSKENDLYPFWHSSARLDPGLNVALYANITVDKLLEDIQSDNEKNGERRAIIFEEIEKDKPAIFLFAPDMLYLPAPEVKNINLKSVVSQSERFLFVTDWFIETDKVWRFLAPENAEANLLN